MSGDKDIEKLEAHDDITPDSPISSTGSITEQHNSPTPPPPQHGPNSPPPPLPTSRAITLVTTLTGASFLNVIGIQSTVIALPTIGASLSIPPAREQWVVSAYSLALGCFLLLFGRLGDVYGKRLIFLWGSAFLCVTSIVAPFVREEVAFEVLRGLQGVGAAASVPTAIGIIGATFPPGRRKNFAFSFFAAGPPLGSVLGNLLGGILVQYWRWEGIFWVIGILAGLVTIAGIFTIPKVDPPLKDKTWRSVDWLGGLLITLSLFALLFALTQGNIVGWGEPYIGTIIGLSILLIALFIWYQHFLERRNNPHNTTGPSIWTPRPLLRPSLLTHHPLIPLSITIQTLAFTTFNNYLILATYLYQISQSLFPIQTTLRFIPTGVTGFLTVALTSYLLSSPHKLPFFKFKYYLPFTSLCLTLSPLLFALPIPESTSYWAYGFPAMCLSVFGIDTMYPCLLLLVTQLLPREDQALGGGIISATAQIGRSVGLAVATAIQVKVQEAHGGESRAYLEGLRAAEWFNFALGLVALGFMVYAGRFNEVGVLGKGKKVEEGGEEEARGKTDEEEGGKVEEVETSAAEESKESSIAKRQ